MRGTSKDRQIRVLSLVSLVNLTTIYARFVPELVGPDPPLM